MQIAMSRPVTRLVTVLAIVVTAMFGWVQWRTVDTGIWVDLDVYVMGARTLLDGGDLYAVASGVDLRFTYSPFAAAVFVPLALLPVGAARFVLTAASAAALAIVITVVARRLELRPASIAWLVVATAALEPIMRNLLLGQVNLILMAMVVIDLLVLPTRRRGFLIGIAAGIKLTPAVFVVYFLLKRDWASLVRTGIGFAASVAVGWLVAPAASASFWGGGFLGLSKFGSDAVVGTDNQSLLAAALRLLGRPELPLVAQAALALAGVALGAAAARHSLRQRGPGAEVSAVVWIAFGGLLGSPVSWSHHWVWVIVVLAVFAARRQAVRAALVLLLFWYPIIWMTYTEQPFGELTFPWWKAALSCVYVIVGLAILIREATRSVAPTRAQRVPGHRASQEQSERVPSVP
ncbi:glycosyltransferase 87 family protein [Terrabacter terrigena]|uniref:Glycosyltransferase 87 family protein n=1 Tax=Terrabacter terrigena TaxID=574718 RepID=A0ABW3MWI7_9MICO